MSTAGPAHRVQSAVVEYGFPQGHLGHLSDEEETAFKNFKILCQEKGYYKPASAEVPETHDDATLLQFKETEDWRKANQLDILYETIDLQQYEETRRLYPQWTGRRDRRGIPVYVFEVRHLNSKAMSAYEKSAKETSSKAKTDGKTPAKLLRLFALYENLIRFVMPLCTALTDREHPRTPITQSNNIVDISGVGLKQFWNLRAHMQDASTLATAHYPETLDRIFIIGAPSFFPTVWGWVKKWFDPITTSKIFILSSHDTQKTLESFIDPANIPVKYGGKLEFVFGDLPVLDPALTKVVEWEEGKKDFPHGPMYWTNKKGQPVEGKHVEDEREIAAKSVGSVKGKQRNDEVCTLKYILGGNDDIDGVTNGHAAAAGTAQILNTASTESEDNKPELQPSGLIVPTRAQLEAPTQPPTPAQEVQESELVTASKTEPSAHEVQEGELVPADRPEPQRFVTAAEGLSLNEKSGNLSPNGSVNGEVKGPHSTATANKLDPNLTVPAAEAGQMK
ncbi:phosphatidylinositol transporter [Diplocarpon mali]|nr:phosphatidylinositol transporter [Diplocarpon mali]